MHFLQNLLNYMCPPFNFLFGSGENLPSNLARVVTRTGAFVVTARNTDVVAKDYV